MATEYLTMWEASKLCSYSQEYLSLLSRRGLLRAEKRGNKWLTTIPWVNEYLADKKPGEVISLQRKDTQFFEEKKSGSYGKYWVIAIAIAIAMAISFVFIVAVVIFNQMSNRISELEAKNNAASRANADAMAGFDSSVLEVESNTARDATLSR